MTLPADRTRALRLGWEFLFELKAATNLTPDQEAKVLYILQGYPSSAEITEWASEDSWLEPEFPDTGRPRPQSCVPQSEDRGPHKFAQRIDALAAASAFFHQELRGSDNLTEEQRCSPMFVCRHFPLATEVDAIVRRDALANPVEGESAFVRRGMAAIKSTIANGDGIPAEAVIAKLESKMAAARQRRAAGLLAGGVLKEHSPVTLTKPLPGQGMDEGAVGVVVHVYADGRTYEVEFFDEVGKTICVQTVGAADLRSTNQ